MAWSTRQLADLAGTTLKTVRHYHAIGLLDEPERTSNGYKQYRVSHLVRLLQIKRLSDLGVPLSQIATMRSADQEPEQAIRDLDAELEATIGRLQRVREELAEILQHKAALDVPAGFSDVADSLSESDRALIMIYSRVYDELGLAELRDMVKDRDASDDEFDALAPDADEATIAELVPRVVTRIREIREDYPWASRPGVYARDGEAAARKTVGRAIAELYNPAQIEVIRRAGLIVNDPARESAGGA